MEELLEYFVFNVCQGLYDEDNKNIENNSYIKKYDDEYNDIDNKS